VIHEDNDTPKARGMCIKRCDADTLANKTDSPGQGIGFTPTPAAIQNAPKTPTY
jgi:hypothetical protein